MVETPRLMMTVAPQAFASQTVQPVDALLALAAPCYALLLLFGLLWLSRLDGKTDRHCPSTS